VIVEIHAPAPQDESQRAAYRALQQAFSAATVKG
jgi:hypothetical protein